MAQLWFKFWAKDYLGDGKIGCLSYEKRGMLQTLWAYAWEEGSIPADPGLLAELLKLSPRAMRSHSLWIGQFFHPSPQNPSRLISPRLEIERMEAADRGAKAQEAALIRWNKRNANVDADALPLDMPEPCAAHAIQSHSHKELKKQKQAPRLDLEPCLAPGDPGAPPAVLVMPCIGKGPKEWLLTEARLEEWRKAYPGVDVLSEAHKMLGWLKAHPKRQKTFEGMAGFALGWLGNAQNPPGDRGSRRPVVPLQVGGPPPTRPSRSDAPPEASDSCGYPWCATWPEHEAMWRQSTWAAQASPEDLEAWLSEVKADWDECHKEAMC